LPAEPSGCATLDLGSYVAAVAGGVVAATGPGDAFWVSRVAFAILVTGFLGFRALGIFLLFVFGTRFLVRRFGAFTALKPSFFAFREARRTRKLKGKK
jgi:hypothetical protein